MSADFLLLLADYPDEEALVALTNRVETDISFIPMPIGLIEGDSISSSDFSSSSLMERWRANSKRYSSAVSSRDCAIYSSFDGRDILEFGLRCALTNCDRASNLPDRVSTSDSWTRSNVDFNKSVVMASAAVEYIAESPGSLQSWPPISRLPTAWMINE
jgi:hypothetical protein